MTRRPRPIAVIGGAGFVGANLAARYLAGGHHVRILDNLSRAGVERNLEWLSHRFDRLEVIRGDVRDASVVRRAITGAGAVYHLAAQVAVTTSMADPLLDEEVNVRGTLHVLEALRAENPEVPLVFTSTNKVYGALDDIALFAAPTRYEPQDDRVRQNGISEARALELLSPYGCSKGAADQYVLDYARHFGLRATVFRMSCIYGPRQFGTEDQGWLAHFLLQALRREPITIYGDGLQVRDVLFVDDLVEALVRARDKIDVLRGRAFNVGGGPRHSVSLRELILILADVLGAEPSVRMAGWRPGDQRYYASDHRALSESLEWSPTVGVQEGVERLRRWLMDLETRRRTAAAQRIVQEVAHG
jgi:CDP-paratose 2-epimerase